MTHSIEEAVYLSDRIVMLKPHPGEVREVMELAMSRPRSRSSIPFIAAVEKVSRLIGHTENDAPAST